MTAPVYNVSVDGNNNDSNLILGSANGSIAEDDNHDHVNLANKLAVLENALNVNSASDLAQAALVSGNIESIKELDSKVTSNETEHKKLRAFFLKYTNHSGNGLSLKEKENLDNIYIVGNSLVDNGNNYKLIKENNGFWDDNLYTQGRFSNKLAFGDYIAMGLGFTPSETINVAQGGARYTKDRDLFDNKDVTVYDSTTGNALTIKSFVSQIEEGISNGKITSNTLVYISGIGPNDLPFFFDGSDYNGSPQEFVTDMVTGVTQIATKLLQSGVPAKNIIFSTTLPELNYATLTLAKSSNSVEIDFITQFRQLLQTINSTVKSTLFGINQEIILIDFYNFVREGCLDFLEVGFDFENTQLTIVDKIKSPITDMEANNFIFVDPYSHLSSQMYKLLSYIFINQLLEIKGLKLNEFPNKKLTVNEFNTRLSEVLGVPPPTPPIKIAFLAPLKGFFSYIGPVITKPAILPILEISNYTVEEKNEFFNKIDTFINSDEEILKLEMKNINLGSGNNDSKVINITFYIANSGSEDFTSVKAIENASKLIEEEGIELIIGPAQSGYTLDLLSEVAIKHNIPMISYANTSPDLTTTQNNGLYSRVVASETLQAILIAKLASQTNNRAVTIYVNNNDGKAMNKAFKTEFEKNSGVILLEIAVGPDDAYSPEKMSQYLDQIKTITGDYIIFGELYYSPVILNYLKDNITTAKKYYFTNTTENPDGYENNLGLFPENSFTTYNPIVKTQLIQEYYSKVNNDIEWQTVFEGKTYDLFQGQSYDCVALTLFALSINNNIGRSLFTSTIGTLTKELKSENTSQSVVIRASEIRKGLNLLNEDKMINYEGITFTSLEKTSGNGYEPGATISNIKASVRLSRPDIETNSFIPIDYEI